MFWDKLSNYHWGNISHWLFMMVVIFFICSIYIILGVIWSKVASKRYGWSLGYKPRWARKGKNAWALANLAMGKTLLFTGSIGIPVSLLIMIPCRHQTISAVITIGCAFILILSAVIAISHLMIRKQIAEKEVS